eukprot:5080956-Amphidinium_carterae.1
MFATHKTVALTAGENKAASHDPPSRQVRPNTVLITRHEDAMHFFRSCAHCARQALTPSRQ